MDIRLAIERDVNQVIKLDKEMIGNERRKEEIVEAIEQDKCLLVFMKSKLAGFLIYHTHFFECCFISLIMIKPSYQRKGLASSLLTRMAKISTTEKLFSSTNQSNVPMQKVFLVNGFKKSGYIENLDEGDPECIYFKSCLSL